MTRLRRRWRVAKWAGVGFCALALLSWGLSLCSWFGLAHNGKDFWQIALHQGVAWVRLVRTPAPPQFAPPGWIPYFTIALGKPVWRNVGLNGSWSGGWDVVLPLWIPFLLVAFPTGTLFYLDRRRIPPHCCLGCGYDLTGNTSGTCPECGEKMEVGATEALQGKEKGISPITDR
jgi:hypothetical protein